MWSKDNNYCTEVKGIQECAELSCTFCKYKQFLKLKGFRKRKDGSREIGNGKYRIFLMSSAMKGLGKNTTDDVER